MRNIGQIEDEERARLFADFLYVKGIANQVEIEEGRWSVWVLSEEDLERAGQWFGKFRENPEDPDFKSVAQGASQLRAQEARQEKEYLGRVIDRRQILRRFGGYGLGPLTLFLIAASVVVFFLSKFGKEVEPILGLFITERVVTGTPLKRLAALNEIRHGEIWRIFTPMFVHFHILHIFFNLLWLRDLGSMVEARLSSRYLGYLVLIIAATSNLAQYAFHGPAFGGLSGVVYGLFGYIWIRGKYDPGSGLFLQPFTVAMMLIWFAVCFTGKVGPIANTVHAVGLSVGMLWGYRASFKTR